MNKDKKNAVLAQGNEVLSFVTFSHVENEKLRKLLNTEYHNLAGKDIYFVIKSTSDAYLDDVADNVEVGENCFWFREKVIGEMLHEDSCENYKGAFEWAKTFWLS